MREERIIHRIVHGSRLYGTQTPESDHDYKEIFIPSGREILLGLVKNGREYGPVKKKDEKNKPGDVDTQAFSAQKFFKMLLAGDIIGCELLFAPPECVLSTSPEFELIKSRKEIFISRKVEGYVGYCRQQAAKYGIRGSRVAAARGLVDILRPYVELQPKMKLDHIWYKLHLYMERTDHCSIESIPNKGTGQFMDHLNCCNKKAPRTITVKEAFHIYQQILDDSGQRAIAAEKNEGIDWKAVSHACRVGEQAIELLQTGNITFPRPNASRLLSIKRGDIDYKLISPYLEELLVRVEEESASSFLPIEPDHRAIDDLTCELYGDQIVQ